MKQIPWNNCVQHDGICETKNFRYLAFFTWRLFWSTEGSFASAVSLSPSSNIAEIALLVEISGILNGFFGFVWDAYHDFGTDDFKMTFSQTQVLKKIVLINNRIHYKTLINKYLCNFPNEGIISPSFPTKASITDATLFPWEEKTGIQ